MLELIVLALFVFSGYLATVGKNLYLNRRDKKQELALADLMIEAQNQGIHDLKTKLGDPYEIEPGTTGRTLYVWKFPPAETIPPGRGLLTIIATTDHDVVVDISYKRKR